MYIHHSSLFHKWKDRKNRPILKDRYVDKLTHKNVWIITTPNSLKTNMTFQIDLSCSLAYINSFPKYYFLYLSLFLQPLSPWATHWAFIAASLITIYYGKVPVWNRHIYHAQPHYYFFHTKKIFGCAIKSTFNGPSSKFISLYATASGWCESRQATPRLAQFFPFTFSTLSSLRHRVKEEPY